MLFVASGFYFKALNAIKYQSTDENLGEGTQTLSIKTLNNSGRVTECLAFRLKI